MPDRVCPVFDVRGLLLVTMGERRDQSDYRLRCYPDGHCVADVDNTTFPIPVTMTAREWFAVFYRHRLGEALDELAMGD